jgi:hypothetical protein
MLRNAMKIDRGVMLKILFINIERELCWNLYLESDLKSDNIGGHAEIPNTLLAKIVASYQARIKEKSSVETFRLSVKVFHSPKSDV